MSADINRLFFRSEGFPPKIIKKSLIFGFIHGVSHIIHRKKTLITHYFYGNHRKYVLVNNAEKQQFLDDFNSLTPISGHGRRKTIH